MSLYTIKQVAEIMDISAHTLRFYDNEGLFPYVSRNDNNIRVFSEHDLEWVRIVQCLRDTDMPLADIRHYIDLCKQGRDTVEERYHIILEQKQRAEQELVSMHKRLEILDKKTMYYQKALQENKADCLNPAMTKLPSA